MKGINSYALPLALISLPLISAIPAHLDERENGCIALCGSCPCPFDPPATTSASPPSLSLAPLLPLPPLDPPPSTSTPPPSLSLAPLLPLPTASPSTVAFSAPDVTDAAWTTIATSALPTVGTKATVNGAPGDDVSCPVPNTSGNFQYFTGAYVSNNIIDIIGNGKKGSYPKEFNKNHGKANQFKWTLNDCQARLDGGENILELPMFLDANGQETYWSKNDDNNRPGPYREYYIVDGTVATYCGAYAHKTEAKDSDFVACS